jgi:CBS domain containing-hemolysin-like protein
MAAEDELRELLHEVLDEHATVVAAAHEATIGGHVAERLGRLPEPDEIVEVDGVQFTVVAVDDTRIAALYSGVT